MVSNMNNTKKHSTTATEKISNIRTARLHRFYIIMGIFIVFVGIFSFQLIHTHYQGRQSINRFKQVRKVTHRPRAKMKP